MIRTFGLTHVALGVEDVERAFGFYASVFGMVAVYRTETLLQAQTPGARDVVVFERSEVRGGNTGGIAHHRVSIEGSRIDRGCRSRGNRRRWRFQRAPGRYFLR